MGVEWLAAVKIDRRITLWIVIGILFLISLFITFKVGGAEQVVGVTKTVASSGMVGGC